MSEGTKFFACEACHDRGCECYPDGDATTFRRDYTGYISGSAYTTIDEDGDPSEGEPDFDGDVYDYSEGGSFMCSCCGHESYRLDANNGLVALWHNSETDAVMLYDGQDEDDYEDEDEDEDDDVSVPEFTLTNIPDDGRTINVEIANAPSTAFIPRETPEVEIIQRQ